MAVLLHVCTAVYRMVLYNLYANFAIRYTYGLAVYLLAVSLNTQRVMGEYAQLSSVGKQDFEELSTSLKREIVQELEVDAILPTSGSNNPELGTDVLTQAVRKVLEKVLEASLERNRELIEGRCKDCGKKRDRNSPKLEPHSKAC
ncbi:hypothetical protein J1N35_010388 [Gossypium stocksii]|uniref:Uncharacterized protein n=1 Tax=Gossypium stocksii TaxID=47602 RepID=A0A9D4ACK4_9ROSI|nr:hypothetical protein J1N35_010388 [Gossypium stocksii]